MAQVKRCQPESAPETGAVLRMPDGLGWQRCRSCEHHLEKLVDYRLERRRTPRLPRHETLFAQVDIAADGGGTRRTVRCLSADLSGGGLRLRTDEAMTPGATTDLWVRLESLGRNFLLRGRVRWVDASQGEAGIAVIWAEGTDYWEWQASALA